MKKHFIEDGDEALGKKSEKKQILLIGDSIREGYCGEVKKRMSDICEVVYPDTNCRNTQFILTSLNDWLYGLCDISNLAAVCINAGHWDMSRWCGDDEPITTKDEYAKNLRMIFRRIRREKPDAEIFAFTTSPLNPNGKCGRNIRTEIDVLKYNEVLMGVCNEENVEVYDLHGFVIENCYDVSDFLDYCHFTNEAFAKIGKGVADFLKENVKALNTIK